MASKKLGRPRGALGKIGAAVHINVRIKSDSMKILDYVCVKKIMTTTEIVNSIIEYWIREKGLKVPVTVVGDKPPRKSSPLPLQGKVVLGGGYWTVNHEQAEQ